MAKSWSEKAKQMLSYLSDDDVFQLAATTSKGHLDLSSRNEAIDVIVAACDTPDELLRRKKLKREYLLRYIWENGRSDPAKTVPIKADKRQLIREVLSLWNCTMATEWPSTSNAYVTEADDDPENGEEDDDADGLYGDSGSDRTTDQGQDSLMNEFGIRFLTWFYEMLNNLATTEDFGPQHFFGNCIFRLRCGSTPEKSVEIAVEGGLAVANRLKEFVLHEKLAFQPNLLSRIGFQATQEPHGAILVKSNGTAHRRPGDDTGHTVLLGPYEQAFLVVEDPQTKTWKIQQTMLAIKAEIAVSNLSIGSG